MANKYHKLAREARIERRERKMCIDKTPFDSPKEAQQKGQRSYKCPICKKWHRSGAHHQFLNSLKGKKHDNRTS